MQSAEKKGKKVCSRIEERNLYKKSVKWVGMSREEYDHAQAQMDEKFSDIVEFKNGFDDGAEYVVEPVPFYSGDLK